jgi:cell shape-determining protein MreD
MFIFFAAVAQRSFIWGLPEPFSFVNMLIVLLVFMTVLGGGGQTLVCAGAAGFILDLYSFLPFGANIAALIASAAAMLLLSESVFTNRSLYSVVALSILSVSVYEALKKIFYFMHAPAAYAGLSGFAKEFGTDIWISIFMNAGAGIVLFYAVHFASKRFKPVFIIRRRS